MTDKIMKFTFRTDEEILRKLQFVAQYDARSANRELEVLVKRHIAEFEKEHGKITIS
ncbi:MAG: Arc family DNA-binding protein [Lachnospiraceae bacterium]